MHPYNIYLTERCIFKGFCGVNMGHIYVFLYRLEWKGYIFNRYYRLHGIFYFCLILLVIAMVLINSYIVKQISKIKAATKIHDCNTIINIDLRFLLFILEGIRVQIIAREDTLSPLYMQSILRFYEIKK